MPVAVFESVKGVLCSNPVKHTIFVVVFFRCGKRAGSNYDKIRRGMGVLNLIATRVEGKNWGGAVGGMNKAREKKIESWFWDDTNQSSPRPMTCHPKSEQSMHT